MVAVAVGKWGNAMVVDVVVLVALVVADAKQRECQMLLVVSTFSFVLQSTQEHFQHTIGVSY